MTAEVAALRNAWATAPGKVIITGEHAVVYGQPALAAAINRLSTAKVTWLAHPSLAPVSLSGTTVTLSMPQMHVQRCLSVAELKQLAEQVAAKHDDFLTGKADLSDLFQQPEDLLLAALGYVINAYTLPINQSLTMELQTDLLLGGGMGSSASLLAALLAAFLTACNINFTQQQLVDHVLVAEHWQHGRSSGLDPQVCVRGGVQSFQQGQARALNVVTPDNLYLVTSGRPQSSTGNCVETVRQQQRTAEFWQQFGDLEVAFEVALSDASAANSLVDLVQANHRLLQSLQLVPTPVAAFISLVEETGGAGKICGAGSVTGDQGGLLLLAGITKNQVQDLCAQAGYDYWPLTWQQQGVVYGVK